MSTMIKKFSFIYPFFAHILFFALSSYAQEFEIKVEIAAAGETLVHIETSFPKGETRKNISFRQTYADAANLDARIENLKFKDDENREVKFIEFSDGEFHTAAKFSTVFYDVKIAVPENALTTAHISWLTETHGLLMLNDLLPDFGENGSAKVSFKLPEKWKISASEKQIGEKTFQVANLQNAVFLVGTDWRNSSVLFGESTVNFSAVGDWNFRAAEAAKISTQILIEYQKIFGDIPEKQINIFLLRPPRKIDFERWRAETRGANVTILSSPTAFEGLAIQRLHEQLRHELFHLWMPNNLSLTGDYAWFYEGFTQYAALRTGLQQNRITFSDFLNTLEQAVNKNENRGQPISLIETSKSRWIGANSGVYSEGMLIAFLCDIALLRQNQKRTALPDIFRQGKKTTDLFDVLRQIYQKHRLPNNQTDGNTAILEILQSHDALIPIVEKYIKGANKINFANNLDTTGIEIVSSKDGSKLQIKAKLQTREKDLLNKLGYNNWRKLLRDSK